jgi:hypothetical protein
VGPAGMGEHMPLGEHEENPMQRCGFFKALANGAVGPCGEPAAWVITDPGSGEQTPCCADCKQDLDRRTRRWSGSGRSGGTPLTEASPLA